MDFCGHAARHVCENKLRRFAPAHPVLVPALKMEPGSLINLAVSCSEAACIAGMPPDKIESNRIL
eukprot:942844-Pyramimonas_sp.AAC.1